MTRPRARRCAAGDRGPGWSIESGLVERQGNLEPGQDVGPDLDRRPAGRLADAALDLVVPLDQLAGQRAIGRADAEPAGRAVVAEDDIPARVGQREGHLLAGDRLE